MSSLSRQLLMKARSCSRQYSKHVCCIGRNRPFATLGPTPPKFDTILGDPTERRNHFFKYSWGTWLKNDAQEKARRETRFSIEGIVNLAKLWPRKCGSAGLEPPSALPDGLVLLSNNCIDKVVGDIAMKQKIKSVASIHEGKHHRIYAIRYQDDTKLVLRIPYALELPQAIAQKIKSEVATLDFLRLKVRARVPRVIAYGPTRENALESPYILMEYVPGHLLMKQWDPLDDSKDAETLLNQVIGPIADFHAQVIDTEFTQSGSLYFYNDALPHLQTTVPYHGEENPTFLNRWRIGPSVERPYTRQETLLAQQLEPYRGPWPESTPMKAVECLAQMKRKAAQVSLDSVTVNNVGPESAAAVATLTDQVKLFKVFETVAPNLVNPESTSIKNTRALFAPRMYIPDLDPLNVLVNKGEYTFIDFEHTCIKPFVLASYPSFVAYQGAKVYDADLEVDGFAEMDELEQQQYRFMQFKTRNERLWEVALNHRRHDLIAVASPFIKTLCEPYHQCLAIKNHKDYLYVKGALIQLSKVWDKYAENDLCCAIQAKWNFTDNEVDVFNSELAEYQSEMASSPFAATKGWIPQDMFETFRELRMLEQQQNGDWQVDTEKFLLELK